MNTELTLHDLDQSIDNYRKSRLSMFHHSHKARVVLHIARPELIKAERELKKALNRGALDLVL